MFGGPQVPLVVFWVPEKLTTDPETDWNLEEILSPMPSLVRVCEKRKKWSAPFEVQTQRIETRLGGKLLDNKVFKRTSPFCPKQPTEDSEFIGGLFNRNCILPPLFENVDTSLD